MSTSRNAIAEDWRRLGIVLIIVGMVGAFFLASVPDPAAISATVVGVLFCFMGYRQHWKDIKT